MTEIVRMLATASNTLLSKGFFAPDEHEEIDGFVFEDLHDTGQRRNHMDVYDLIIRRVEDGALFRAVYEDPIHTDFRLDYPYDREVMFKRVKKVETPVTVIKVSYPVVD